MKNTTSTQPTNKLLAQLTQRELKTLRRNFDENDFLINQGKNTIDFAPVVKFFNPTGIGMWYLTELSPDNIGFGICSLEYSELGYVSLNELNNLKFPYGLRIEKDITFSAKGLTLSKFIEEIREKDFKSYDYLTPTPNDEKQEDIEKKTEKIVQNHILIDQTDLVELCLEERLIPLDYIINTYSFFDHNGNTLEKEEVEKAKKEDELYMLDYISEKDISSWFLVTEWIAEKLEAKNEPLIRCSLGTWWGRVTFGQPIMQDRVIQEIAYECF